MWISNNGRHSLWDCSSGHKLHKIFSSFVIRISFRIHQSIIWSGPLVQPLLDCLIDYKMNDSFANSHIGGCDAFVKAKNSSLSVNFRTSLSNRLLTIVIQLKSCLNKPYRIGSGTTDKTLKSRQSKHIRIFFRVFVSSLILDRIFWHKRHYGAPSVLFTANYWQNSFVKTDSAVCYRCENVQVMNSLSGLSLVSFSKFLWSCRISGEYMWYMWTHHALLIQSHFVYCTERPRLLMLRFMKVGFSKINVLHAFSIQPDSNIT